MLRISTTPLLFQPTPARGRVTGGDVFRRHVVAPHARARASDVANVTHPEVRGSTHARARASDNVGCSTAMLLFQPVAARGGAAARLRLDCLVDVVSAHARAGASDVPHAFPVLA